jgi:glycosyltransferase involved in cell wall biosynthesis
VTDSLFSIVLPVHNQSDHVVGILEEYCGHLDYIDINYELIVVTNNCSDESPKNVEAFAGKNPRVRHIDLPKEKGWGRAVREGIAASTGEFICFTNSARTSAKDLGLLLLYARNYGLVVLKANRKIRESFLRRAGSLLYNLECRALFDMSCWDVNGTPKVFPRKFEQLLDLKENGDLIDAEFDALCFRNGYPLLEVPIFSSRRHGGRSTTNVKSALGMYLGVFALRRRLNGKPD